MKRIAAVVTEYRYLSHAQVICDRFLEGYSIFGRHHVPETKIVSMYVDQFPENDQSRERAEQYGFTIYPDIPAALRQGGSRLDVDGVLVIGEHGNYPYNERGQHLYPRYELFKQVVEVFDADRKSVPVFCDKHLSWSFEKAAWMVEQSKRLGFAMLGGSSIPVAWRLPALELPFGCELEEAVAVGYGGMDSYDFHALEGLQCMTERRKGGETGVRAVQYIEGEEVWTEGVWWKEGDKGVWSVALLEAAMSRSDSPGGNADLDGRPENLVRLGHLPGLVRNPAAYVLEYADGCHATMLMLNGGTKEFLFSAKLKGAEKPVSCQFFLTPVPNVNHFSGLVANIEAMFLTGKAPYPVERTLLVSGVLEACLAARHEKIRRMETPQLMNVRYIPSAESRFLRD